MREFYFKDKNKNFAFRGVAPNNDLNCPPFDFFKYGHALNASRLFGDVLKVKCPIPIPSEMVNKFVLEQTETMIAEMLGKSTANPKITQLLTDDSLSYKDQNKLLKDLKLSATDLLWMNKEAQELGFLLDIYHEEKYPEKFNEKQKPMCYHQKDNGTMETIGATEMSDGELRALLEQRKVVQARVYHKDNHWHCFYFTFKGLAGLESGVMGSKPHYHYLSDKSGIAWDELIQRIKDCDMPTSKVHIIIER